VKTETIKDFLERGGQVKVLPLNPQPSAQNVAYIEKAQTPFWDQPVDEVISETFGLASRSEVDNDSLHG
jgi:hypothetical protein